MKSSKRNFFKSSKISQQILNLKEIFEKKKLNLKEIFEKNNILKEIFPKNLN